MLTYIIINWHITRQNENKSYNLQLLAKRPDLENYTSNFEVLTEQYLYIQSGINSYSPN
jgi:hypothetical protein